MPAYQSSTTVLDSILFRDAFGTPGMRQVFSDRAFITRCVEVEVALAKAEARCGVSAERRKLPTAVLKTHALQTLPRFPTLHEPREASGLRAVHRRSSAAASA